MHAHSASTFIDRLPVRYRMAAGVVVLALAALAWMGAGRFCSASNPLQIAAGTVGDSSAINPLVHWRESGHHWLVVADASRRHLLIYDAASGRPIQQLNTIDRVGRMDAIQRRGKMLLVTPSGCQHALTLPDLAHGSLASR